MRSDIPIGSFVAALVLAGACLVLGRPATAAGTPDSVDNARVNLRQPESYAEPLIPATTGQLVVPNAPEPQLPRRVSFGVNDLGEQLRFHFNPNWASEFRYLTGSSSSDLGRVHANVFGMRGYRFFPEHRRLRFYAGLEGDYVKTSIGSVNTTGNQNSIATISGFGDTSGYALGGFGGVELRIGRRVAIDLDVGPYMIGLKEKVTGVSDTTLDFVGNTAINVYLF